MQRESIVRNHQSRMLLLRPRSSRKRPRPLSTLVWCPFCNRTLGIREQQIRDEAPAVDCPRCERRIEAPDWSPVLEVLAQRRDRGRQLRRFQLTVVICPACACLINKRWWRRHRCKPQAVLRRMQLSQPGAFDPPIVIHAINAAGGRIERTRGTWFHPRGRGHYYVSVKRLLP